ncbi:ThuA domain-containing protein [Cohnella endophytica]|uniref:ThuA domain-containing protein n=1 Tax=Cohnella endophytica TaxID=2419778 RepID=A0A494Y078_9BACL|nr:ThuA domain-containing protein [Cohnella endophytica]
MQALALGNYSDAIWHPFGGIDKEIEQIFAERIDVRSTGDYGMLKEDYLSPYRLFISYTEFLDEKLSQERVAALLSFVAKGGGFLGIHNGISLQRNQELATMIGGRFVSHPDYTALPIHILEPNHRIMDRVEPFTVNDEPYRFDFDPYVRTTILAEYEHEGERWPAAWMHQYGLGRVVYLMPGHEISAFKVEAYRKLILNAGLWAAKAI